MVISAWDSVVLQCDIAQVEEGHRVCDGQKNGSPKDVHILMPASCEYVKGGIQFTCKLPGWTPCESPYMWKTEEQRSAEQCCICKLGRGRKGVQLGKPLEVKDTEMDPPMQPPEKECSPANT